MALNKKFSQLKLQNKSKIFIDYIHVISYYYIAFNSKQHSYVLVKIIINFCTLYQYFTMFYILFDCKHKLNSKSVSTFTFNIIFTLKMFSS